MPHLSDRAAIIVRVLSFMAGLCFCTAVYVHGYMEAARPMVTSRAAWSGLASASIDPGAVFALCFLWVAHHSLTLWQRAQTLRSIIFAVIAVSSLAAVDYWMLTGIARDNAHGRYTAATLGTAFAVWIDIAVVGVCLLLERVTRLLAPAPHTDT